MKPTSITPHTLSPTQFCNLRPTHLYSLVSFSKKLPKSVPRFFAVSCSSSSTNPSVSVHVPQKNQIPNNVVGDENLKVEMWNAKVPSYLSPGRLSLSDQAFFLVTFIVCTASISFAGFVIAAVPALHAMGRAAISLSKLTDTAREELPSTMSAVRLSGMEISDLTLELSDLSQEISDGVKKSAQAVQGVRQIGSLAQRQTISMIQERASLPIISIKPVIAGAARKTSKAIGQATKTLISKISRGESSLDS